MEQEGFEEEAKAKEKVNITPLAMKLQVVCPSRSPLAQSREGTV